MASSTSRCRTASTRSSIPRTGRKRRFAPRPGGETVSAAPVICFTDLSPARTSRSILAAVTSCDGISLRIDRRRGARHHRSERRRQDQPVSRCFRPPAAKIRHGDLQGRGRHALPLQERARLGIGRTYQTPVVPDELTVGEVFKAARQAYKPYLTPDRCRVGRRISCVSRRGRRDADAARHARAAQTAAGLPSDAPSRRCC